MNKLFYSIYLLIVFLSIWGPIPNNIGGIIIVLFFLLWFCFDKNFIFLSPALTIPFIFVLKSKSLESLVIAGLTDILMILAITYYFLNINSFSSINKKNVSIPVFLIILHLLYTSLNGVYYMEGITMYLVFLRTYVLPLLYLLVLVLVSKNNSRIPLNGFRFFVIGLFIVQCIAIFQYYDFIKIPSDNAILAKYVTGMEGDFDSKTYITIPKRDLIGLLLPRLNMLIGGSVGSSASIVFALGLLSLFSIRAQDHFNNVFKIIISFVFLFAAVLTISTSILISILIFSFFYLMYLNKNLYKIFIYYIIPLFLIISTSTLISINGDLRIIDYIELIYFNYDNSLLDLDWILGKGPILFSSGFKLRPENFNIDVGIFRVIQESGIINMLILITFIYKVITKSIYDIKFNKSKLIIIFSVLFVIPLLSVHTNFIIYPPFNILFAICTAWLLSKDRKKDIQII